MTWSLSHAELQMLRTWQCPDCNHVGFRTGARAVSGHACNVNIECCGCGARFNVYTRIILGERLPTEEAAT